MENEYGVSEIIMKPIIHCYCPLGEQWYEARLEIKMIPGNEIPDYMDIQKFIRDEVEGQKYIIEQMIDRIYNAIIDYYKPRKLSVKADVEQGNHFAVLITKETE